MIFRVKYILFILLLSPAQYIIAANKNCKVDVFAPNEALYHASCGLNTSEDVTGKCRARIATVLCEKPSGHCNEVTNPLVLQSLPLAGIDISLFLYPKNQQVSSHSPVGTATTDENGVATIDNIKCFSKETYSGYTSRIRVAENAFFKRVATGFDDSSKDYFGTFLLPNRRGNTFDTPNSKDYKMWIALASPPKIKVSQLQFSQVTPVSGQCSPLSDASQLRAYKNQLAVKLDDGNLLLKEEGNHYVPASSGEGPHYTGVLFRSKLNRKDKIYFESGGSSAFFINGNVKQSMALPFTYHHENKLVDVCFFKNEAKLSFTNTQISDLVYQNPRILSVDVPNVISFSTSEQRDAFIVSAPAVGTDRIYRLTIDSPGGDFGRQQYSMRVDYEFGQGIKVWPVNGQEPPTFKGHTRLNLKKSEQPQPPQPSDTERSIDISFSGMVRPVEIGKSAIKLSAATSEISTFDWQKVSNIHYRMKIRERGATPFASQDLVLRYAIPNYRPGEHTLYDYQNLAGTQQIELSSEYPRYILELKGLGADAPDLSNFISVKRGGSLLENTEVSLRSRSRQEYYIQIKGFVSAAQLHERLSFHVSSAGYLMPGEVPSFEPMWQSDFRYQLTMVNKTIAPIKLLVTGILPGDQVQPRLTFLSEKNRRLRFAIEKDNTFSSFFSNGQQRFAITFEGEEFQADEAAVIKVLVNDNENKYEPRDYVYDLAVSENNEFRLGLEERQVVFYFDIYSYREEGGRLIPQNKLQFYTGEDLTISGLENFQFGFDETKQRYFLRVRSRELARLEQGLRFELKAKEADEYFPSRSGRVKADARGSQNKLLFQF